MLTELREDLAAPAYSQISSSRARKEADCLRLLLRASYRDLKTNATNSELLAPITADKSIGPVMRRLPPTKEVV